MDQNTTPLMFALLRSAICGTKLDDAEKQLLSDEVLQELYVLSKTHDVAHLCAVGLDANGLLRSANDSFGKEIITAIYRHAQLNHEYVRVCDALENAHIPFVPLKGSVLRQWYPEPWMRTSCDIDILVRKEDLEQAMSYLIETLAYTEKDRSTHDVSLYSKNGQHIELHFDLVEEGRAGNAINLLKNVWDNVSQKAEKEYWYEMSDAFFYFYHIAHMAKHFEVGGCGVRPFVDLWILDKLDGVDLAKRDELLEQSGLLRFADVSRRLSKCWLEGVPLDEVTMKAQSFLLTGGVYGNERNRVALQQKKKGGKYGYLLSRIFAPYDTLKRYYPILEKHRWLTPVMQVRRWLMLFQPRVARMAKSELSHNREISRDQADEMYRLLSDIGL